MSDSIRNDDMQVDPRLDALLGRALGRGVVSRQQRQRHLERLGLAPRLGGSAGQWRAPVVSGRPPSSASSQPDPLPARRRRRQWAELGAAVLAVFLVGALLVALFRDWSGGEDDQQLAASPEATEVTLETQERLYVVSHVYGREEGFSVELNGRLTAYNATTGAELFGIDTGSQVEAAVSRDGKRLFIAAIDEDTADDELIAVDAPTGNILWRTGLEDRLHRRFGIGPPAISVSADGSRVYIQNYDGAANYWVNELDGTTGTVLHRIETDNCRSGMYASPDDRTLYVLCDGFSRVRAIDLETLTITELDTPTVNIAGASVSDEDGLLYIVAGNDVIVVDMNARSVAEQVTLDLDVPPARMLQLVALSRDGSRLFIGLGTDVDAESAAVSSREMAVFDTGTWREIGRMTVSPPITGGTLSVAPDDRSIYAVRNAFREGTSVATVSSLLRLSLEASPSVFATREREEVLAILSSRVEVPVEGLIPLPTPTPEPSTQERLFAVSNFSGNGGDETGRVTAYDAETGSLVYRIDTGSNPDAVLSPDGTRLFVIASNDDGGGDTLASYAALSGDKNWSVAIEHRVLWPDGAGPTTLAVSQDGSRLFVYSDQEPGDNTIQVFDTADGRLGRVIQGVTHCTAQLFPSADGRSLYVVCLAERFAPQVIDLEAWMSAGVMQGFGGIISGAAASPDGRYLYIPHDIDTELRLTVIDMNGRVIANQRDIVHMASDPLHALNITAISPDDSRLFIGLGSQPEGEAPIASQVWVWDTSMLHVESQKIPAPDAINGWSLAPGPDNSSVFAVHNEDGPDAGGQPSQEAVIMRLSVDDGSEEFVRYWGGDILRVFSGRITDTPQPPSTDETDTLLPDLTVPDNLPLFLSLGSRLTTGSENERLLFNGNGGIVVQIDVRRWTEGETLDPPDGSTPVQIGSLTVYVTPDPEGGWPRIAFWHDQRFVYSLSVLSFSPDGWTQDDLLAVVTAFSSPASTSICPAATWVGPESRRLGGMESYWIDGESLALSQAEGRLVEGANKINFATEPDNQIVDPAPGARVAMTGTRLFTGYERSVPLELLDHTIDWNVPADGGVQHFIRSTVIFPTYGCWQIEAEFGTGFLRAVVNVEPDYSIRNPSLIWDVLRWRPLHELGIDPTPPCVRMPPRQVINGLGPLVGDAEVNGGPVYLSGLEDDGAIRVGTDPSEDGGYYALVSFVTSGDYTGPLLVRPAPGGGPIGFSSVAPDPDPPGEWHLQDPADIMPTGGVRQWVVYLRFASPGCHALQIDGLDFSSTIAFEVVADEALNEPKSPTWDGSLYALFHEEGNSGVVELDGLTGEVVRRIDMTPYGNSYPHLEVSPEADRLAVAGSLPGEPMTLDVLIYRLSDFTLLQRVPVPTLIQSHGISDGIALSPDGRFLYAYQYETPPDGNGNNARYWLGTFDLESQTWLADVELSGFGTVTQIDASLSPRVFVECSQAGLRVVDTDDGTASFRIDSGSQVAWFEVSDHGLGWLTEDGSSFWGGDLMAEDYHELIAGLNSPQHVPVPDGMSIATLPYARLDDPQVTYVPLGPIDNDPTEIAVAEIPWSRVTRTIQTSAPFREIVFASDGQLAFVTLTNDDGFTTSIARIDMVTGAETTLTEGFFGNLVAVSSAEP